MPFAWFIHRRHVSHRPADTRREPNPNSKHTDMPQVTQCRPNEATT